mgnify:FL=1
MSIAIVILASIASSVNLWQGLKLLSWQRGLNRLQRGQVLSAKPTRPTFTDLLRIDLIVLLLLIRPVSTTHGDVMLALIVLVAFEHAIGWTLQEWKRFFDTPKSVQLLPLLQAPQRSADEVRAATVSIRRASWLRIGVIGALMFEQTVFLFLVLYTIR